MDKNGYPQPSNEAIMFNNLERADLEKWANAHRDIWRLSKIAGISLSDAKNIVIRGWSIDEKDRFERWVRFYESEDDKKYKPALAYIDCDLTLIKTAALKLSKGLGGERGKRFTKRISKARNARSVVDYIKAMSVNPEIIKQASQEKERAARVFEIVRSIQTSLSKKKVVRNLARVLAMDKDGIYPEISQALAKLIDSYNYATTRVQDVMGRLGLQLSIGEEEPEEDKLSEPIEAPEVVKNQPGSTPLEKTKNPFNPVKQERTTAPVSPKTENTTERQLAAPIPRVENRGL